MTDTIDKKRGQTRWYYGFRVKLMVFKALTKCFRRVFFVYWNFAFICYIICSPMTYCPVKDSFSFLGGMNPDTSFSCYLISVLSLNIFVLSKYWLIFALSHCFILFLSTSDAVSSVKTGKNRYLLSYKLISVTVICSIFLCSTVLCSAVSILFLFLSIIAFFMSSICFLVELSHYWQFRLKESIVGKMHSVRRRRIWFCYLFLLYSLYFLCWDTVISQNFMDFFCFCLCLFSFCCYTPYT